jgi:hypothetical protein
MAIRNQFTQVYPFVELVALCGSEPYEGATTDRPIAPAAADIRSS